MICHKQISRLFDLNHNVYFKPLQTKETTVMNKICSVTSNICPLLIAEGLLLLLVFIALPVYAISQANKSDEIKLKGLALPQGSVRSMLALTVVGSFVIFLIFGGTALPTDTRFTEIVAALTGIAGTIVGFYFGSGGSGSSVK